MNELHIYSSKRFHVNECGFVEDAPCAQVLNFWSFRTLEHAIEKLKELGKDYKTYDHRGGYQWNDNIEAKEYAD